MLKRLILQTLKRGVSGDIPGQDVPEGPPLPPTATHPLYHQQQTDEGNLYCDIL